MTIDLPGSYCTTSPVTVVVFVVVEPSVFCVVCFVDWEVVVGASCAISTEAAVAIPTVANFNFQDIACLLSSGYRKPEPGLIQCNDRAPKSNCSKRKAAFSP